MSDDSMQIDTCADLHGVGCDTSNASMQTDICGALHAVGCDLLDGHLQRGVLCKCLVSGALRAILE
jgi:hypothetical protein